MRHRRGVLIVCICFCGMLAAISIIGLTYRADALEQGYIEPEPDTVARTSIPLSEELQRTVEQSADHYGLDPALVYAVIEVESRGDPLADNGQCVGLMQLDRQYTAAFCAGAHVQGIADPADNIAAGCWWLSELLSRYDGDTERALAAYNLGTAKADMLWELGARSTSYTHAVMEVIDNGKM